MLDAIESETFQLDSTKNERDIVVVVAVVVVVVVIAVVRFQPPIFIVSKF